MADNAVKSTLLIFIVLTKNVQKERHIPVYSISGKKSTVKSHEFL